MRIFIFLMGVMLFTCTDLSGQAAKSAFSVLDTFPNVRDLTMLNSGQEAYVTLQSPLEEISVIARLEKLAGIWTIANLPTFTGKYKDLEPSLSIDGLRLYFASNRPISNTETAEEDFNIWYVERAELTSEWGDAINIGEPVNSAYNEFYPSVSKTNTIYFTSDRPESHGKDDLFMSRWSNNVYDEAEVLDTSINSAGYEYNAFVSPNEDFIIFGAYNRPDGSGSGDLYISYNKDGKWTKAQNLGQDINSAQMDYCPYYDEANQKLYFTSKRSLFQPVNKFSTLDLFLQEIKKAENGQSKIYSIDFNAALMREK